MPVTIEAYEDWGVAVPAISADPGPGPSFITSQGTATVVVSPSSIEMGLQDATLYLGTAPGESTTGTVTVDIGPNTAMPVTYTIAYRPNSSASWVFGTPTQISIFSNKITFSFAQELNGAQYYIKLQNGSGTAVTGILSISKSGGTPPPPSPPPPSPSPSPPSPSPSPPSPSPSPPPSGPGPSFVTSDGSNTVALSPSTLQLGLTSGTINLGYIAQDAWSPTGTVTAQIGPNTTMPVTYAIAYRPNPTTPWVFGPQAQTSSYTLSYEFSIEQEVDGAQYYVQLSNDNGTASSGIVTINENFVPSSIPLTLTPLTTPSTSNTSFGFRGQNRTKITNANLKTYSDPAQNYYLNDVPRPIDEIGKPQGICSFTRYISFKITGTYANIKNVRIEIPAGFTADKWRVNYGLRNSYTVPSGSLNEFNKISGDYDSSLNTLTESVTLYPRLSTISPESASQVSSPIGPNKIVWTEYLVLQFMAHPSTYDDVDNFGTDTIKLIVDELEN